MRSTRKLRLAVGFALVAATTAFAVPARAASKFTDLDKEPAIRNKLELSAGRFEVAPFLGVSLVDGSFNRVLMLGAHVKYHVTGWLDLGAHVGGTVAKLGTSIRNDICDVRTELFGGVACTDTDPSEFPNRTRTANYEAFVQAAITPIYGKVALFAALFLRYEFSLFGGFGIVGTNRLDATDGKLRVSPTFGTGVKLYFTEFVALDIQFRDTVVLDNWYGVLNADGSLRVHANNLAMFTFGVAVLLPFKALRSK